MTDRNQGIEVASAVKGCWGCQAIVTRYYGPTNHRPSRVKAWCDAGSLMVSWDHALGSAENHAAVAFALASKLGWDGEWSMGGAPQKGTPLGYVFTWNRGQGFTVGGAE